MTSALRELIGQFRGIGHKEHPLLAREYSPNSRVICAGFAEWLAGRISEDDVRSCQDFVCEIVGGGHAFDHEVAYICGIDLSKHLNGASPQNADLLKACMLILATEGGFATGCYFVGEESEYLARVALPMSLSFPAMRAYLDVVNPFITRMRKETGGAWTELQPLACADVQTLPDIEWGCIGPTRARLDRVSVSAREHFIDIVHRSNAGRRAVGKDDSTFYQTRRRGIQPDRTIAELLSAGLVASPDLPMIAGAMTKEQLHELLDQGGVKAYKSWKKDKLSEAAVENMSDVLVKEAANLGLVRPNVDDPAVKALMCFLGFYERQFAVMLTFFGLEWRKRAADYGIFYGD